MSKPIRPRGHRLQLAALDHAQALLEREDAHAHEVEERMCLTLINLAEQGIDAESDDCDAIIDEYDRILRERRGRYQSAFNKLAFEIGEIDRLPHA